MEKNKKTFKQKLSALWKDKRPHKKRLFYSTITVFAACFTFLFFGPVEMVAFGGEMLNYTYKDILMPLSLFSVGVFLSLSLLISLLKGKIFNYIITAISSATLCGYIQAALFNGNLGSLGGENIDWAMQKRSLLLNLSIWFVIFLIFYLCLYLSRKIWKKMLICVSVLLIVMQSASAIGIFTGAYEETKTQAVDEYFLSDKGFNEFSSNSNTFVFVLDYMDYDYIEQIKATDSSFFDKLDGFIEYTDAIPVYGRTKPALNNILTGNTELPYFVSASEFLTNSWTANGKNILEDISKQGYSIEMYTNFKNLFGEPEYPSEYVSNAYHDSVKFNIGTLIKKMSFLSAYRYSPLAFKPFFWSDTKFYNDGVLAEAEEQIYATDDAYYGKLLSEATANNSKNSFKFYHLYGSHPPYSLAEDGSQSATPTSAVAQTKGCFNNLFAAFEQMKNLGIYENATIIITADHGNVSKFLSETISPMRIGLFYKPSGSAGTPIIQSSAEVSSANIAPTILKSMGADYQKYGKALDDIKEGEAVERIYHRAILGKGWYELKVQKYSVKGNTRSLSSWSLLETKDVKYSFYG